MKKNMQGSEIKVQSLLIVLSKGTSPRDPEISRAEAVYASNGCATTRGAHGSRGEFDCTGSVSEFGEIARIQNVRFQIYSCMQILLFLFQQLLQ